LLAAAWDTLGWAYFKLGDLDKAHRYVNAAWMLSGDSACADHLGQIYERQGKTQQAIHSYQLALAANSALDETRERLKKLVGAPKSLDPGELGKLRTTALPGLTQMNGSGEFFVLFSAHKVEDVQFIDGVENLSKATDALTKAHYDVPFPDDGPEKIVRRGILSCSTYTTPHCQFVFLLPSLAQK
jgi:tetratricopeptide (TPR) repeat protein